MMYDELYQFLIAEKQLYVPGIGTFFLNRKPAGANFINKCIYPPAYEFTLKQAPLSNSLKFFTWLGSAHNISNGEAVILFNDFAFEMKKHILAGNEIEWNGVGILSKGTGGEINFVSSENSFLEEPVSAEKIIREHAEHTVLVGEMEKTSFEMTKILKKPEEKVTSWWAVTLVVGILAVMFIGWHFSEQGLKTSSAANQRHPLIKVSESTYSYLQ